MTGLLGLSPVSHRGVSCKYSLLFYRPLSSSCSWAQLLGNISPLHGPEPHCPADRANPVPQRGSQPPGTVAATVLLCSRFLQGFRDDGAGLRASGKDSAPTVVSGILGGSVTLPLNISVDTEIENVIWIGPKNALAFARPKENVTIMVKSYLGRLDITKWSYSLCISNLTLNDAGSYKAQINQRNFEVTTEEEFTLFVYEQLQEPQVTMKSVKVSENFSCNITLMCSVKGAEKSVLYSWTPREPHASESNGGSILTVSRTPCDPDLPYICTAQNPVSQRSSLPVHVGQFCTDPGASRGGTTGETVVGVLGEPVTLPLALPACRDTEKVVWLFNTSIISKEREEAATADPLIKSRDPYKNRVWVSSQDCSLKISQLKIEDAGPYHAYVCSEASSVTSMTHVTLLIYRPERNTKLWIGLFLMVCLLCVGIFSWCIWKRKGRCSVPAFCSSQAEAPADTPEPTAGHTLYSVLSQGYEKLDTPLRPARQQPTPTSDSSSDSNLTTEEDEDRPEVHKPISGRYEVFDQVTQEGAGHDPAPEGQADYDPVTPYVTEVESVVGENTMYAQVFNLQGKTPVSQKEESSATIYCSIRKPQVVPPPQQNDLEIPESPTYENFT
ncbi:T-lymphocyte surface antigen Ly-9 isoform X6 [Homo sapiens]|uniref:T-lymphocyte surface antigen Ly-9 isoform X6 n=1 Tax=Homo sapiens TaxID=9606 RepID=UPI000387B16B|nr:T-lymphocyte surface antigen Ly-9 isoform X6 [Homo sapiens]XP_054192605.1 T-lymphocyte surface antigen Ly-9 isoform X6 [Homo sapiens]|eukprot:XP_011507858.1 T-lymphocyte surface antigen Ly-9 isoform X11 [Homo sapiens]